MAQVKLALRDLSVSDKIVFAQNLVSQLTGNPDFPTPLPPLTTLTADITALQTAYNEQLTRQSALQDSTLDLDAKEDKLDASLNTLGAYVQATSGGDEAKIVRAGLSVRGDRSALTPVSRPDNLTASSGDDDATMDLSWNRVPGAKSYAVQSTTTDPTQPTTQWTSHASSTRSSTTLANLTPGTRYWFRVAAVGPLGQGPWSDPATKVAQ